MASHIVLSSTPHLGHIRALSVVASKIVVEKDAIVTVLVPNWKNVVTKVLSEFERSLQGVVQKGRIRLVGFGTQTVHPMDVINPRPSDFEPVWKALVSGESVTCAFTGTVFDGAPAPKFIVIEQFMHPLTPFIRSYSPSIPIGLWAISAAASYMRLVGPAKYGGVGELVLSLPLDLAEPVPIPVTGEIVKIPGIPPIYDHESFPQEHEHAAVLMPFEANIVRTVWEADFSLTAFWDEYEHEAVSLFTTWMAERGRKTYNVGPLLPLQPGTTRFSEAAMQAEVAAVPGTVGRDVMTFLNNSLAKYGPKCLVYIAFGTHFWPTKTEHLVLFIETLTAHKIPFIFTMPSPQTVFPEEVKKAYERSELGMITTWAPQQTVLAHEATGWFLTHAGYNSSTESISQGVPMLIWPVAADQPIQAIHLERNLDVAFELKEVRGGHGLKPILGTGKTHTGTLEAFKEELECVIRDMRGPVGLRKRANVEKLQRGFIEAWAEGGSARKNLDAFLETI